ncbi:uncharacterized protein LOC122854949 [Aphidius gifuensis]|uniref:uncharacterized protein LOC122854949 n=1 Tax=Aphidius gifuensis TaxID=684658 RepID=UPI001CDCC81E|nr:uncharacterized protein LOC122854949 [Aphidius gifuensis]XP_044011920.1 uncharacterized protein LOC122854949 [Aphidius gifuensis]XP_044011921.1 uncharacterized protein LOC122854949 [Aphidius gifuensis]
MINWVATYTVRKQLMAAGNNQISIEEYFNKFIALKTNFGKELLKRDFEKIFPGKSALFIQRWKLIADYFSEYLIRPSVVSTIDKPEFARLLPRLSDDEKVAVILFLLPCILPDNTRKRAATSTINEGTSSATSSRQGRNRLSLKERRDSCFLQIEDPTNFNSCVQEHQRLLKSSGLSFQPTIAFVGPLDAVESSYVFVNEIIYPVSSPLEALNHCFQIFWVLDCKYPLRANIIWSFLQTAGYQITTKDRLTQAVVTLNHNINEKINAANNIANPPL